jgi:hypothetical protein
MSERDSVRLKMKKDPRGEIHGGLFYIFAIIAKVPFTTRFLSSTSERECEALDEKDPSGEIHGV